jgi:hypothetical protein
MSSDLQASISTNAGPTIATLGRVDSQLKQIHATTGQLTQAHGRFQQASGEAFKRAHEAAEGFGNQVREASHALSQMRGPLGELADGLKQTATLGMRGGLVMGAIAAAATVAGMAFEGLNHVLERRTETLKTAMEAEDKYQEVLRKGAIDAEQNAKGGLSQADLEKRVAGIRGGSDLATKITQDNPGVTTEEARRAVIALQKIRDPKARAGVLAAAEQFAAAGGGSVTQGIELAQGSALVRGTAASGQAARAAALMLEKENTGRFQGGDVRALHDAQARVANDFLAQGQNRAISGPNGENAQQALKEAQAAGFGVDDANKRAMDALKDPTMKPLEDIARATRETAEHLRRLAEAETGIARAWHALPGTGDSAKSQYEQFLKDHASELTTGENR